MDRSRSRWARRYWAGYAADVIECDRAGEAELEPADSELEEAEILANGRSMDWDEVVRRAEQQERARAAFSTSPHRGRHRRRVVRDDTFGHYDEHMPEIRAFVV